MCNSVQPILYYMHFHLFDELTSVLLSASIDHIRVPGVSRTLYCTAQLFFTEQKSEAGARQTGKEI